MKGRAEGTVEIGTERRVYILDDTECLHNQALLLSSASSLLIPHLGLYPVTAVHSLSRPFLHSMFLPKISLFPGRPFCQLHLLKFLVSFRLQLISHLLQETCQLHMVCYPHSTMSPVGTWICLIHSSIIPDTK